MSDDNPPSPSSAVRRVTSGEERAEAADEAVQEATADHQAAEGAETTSSLSSRQGLRDALLQTEPSRPLERVEAPWDPERGGLTRAYRGLQKMLDWEGTPAVVDLFIGAAEWAKQFEPDGGEQDESDGPALAEEDGLT